MKVINTNFDGLKIIQQKKMSMAEDILEKHLLKKLLNGTN